MNILFYSINTVLLITFNNNQECHYIIKYNNDMIIRRNNSLL